MHRKLTLVILVSVLCLALGSAQAAQQLLGSGPIVRPTAHTAFWCPIEVYGIDFSFEADGTEISVVFIAQTHGNDFDFPGGWLRNRIDNVTVVTESVFLAHINAINPDNYFCLFGTGELFFFQDVAPGDLVFLDTFDSAADPGWDMSDGAYFTDTSSAPEDLYTHNDDGGPYATGGSLGLGAENAVPGLATTTINIAGMTPGETYVLSFWWQGNFEGFDEFFNPITDGDLWVEIYGSEDPVPSENSTWGGVKSLYHGSR